MAITKMRFVGRAAPTRICGVTDRSCGVRVDRPSIDNLPPAWAYCSALRGRLLGRAARGSVSPRKVACRQAAAGRELMKAVQGHQLALEGGSNRAAPLSARGPLVLGLVKEQAIGLWH